MGRRGGGLTQKRCLSSPPLPLLLSPAVVICPRHLPPAICCLLLWHNLPPNLVPCRSPHPPLLWHCLPPHHLTRYIVHRPPSAQQYRRHSHCCHPLLTPTALIAPSTSYCLLLSHCPPASAIAAATFSLLRPVSSRPSIARSRHAISKSVRQHCPCHCCHDVPMQSLQDADVDINIGVDCIFLASPTLGKSGLPFPFLHCSRRSPPPLPLLLSSPRSLSLLLPPLPLRSQCHQVSCRFATYR